MSKGLARDLSQMRFLVADDKPFIRKTVRGMLQRMRVKHILEASCGQEAVDELRKNGANIDFVISDWNMEPMGGLELLRAIRIGNAHEKSWKIPFIMLTVNADSGMVHAALALDLNGYIVKPVAFDKLAKAIDFALSHSIKMKPSSYYRDVAIREIPLLEHLAAATPWVMWMSRLAKRAQFQECLRHIRSEAKQLNRGRTDLGQKPDNRRESAISRIPVGAVLAEDIFDAECALLVQGGTQLTPRLLGCFHELVVESGEEFKLWIGDC